MARASACLLWLPLIRSSSGGCRGPGWMLPIQAGFALQLRNIWRKLDFRASSKKPDFCPEGKLYCFPPSRLFITNTLLWKAWVKNSQNLAFWIRSVRTSRDTQSQWQLPLPGLTCCATDSTLDTLLSTFSTLSQLIHMATLWVRYC